MDGTLSIVLDSAHKYRVDGRPDLARDILLKNLSEFVNEPELHFVLADAYYLLGAPGDARSFYESGLKLAPDNCDARLNLVRLYMAFGDLGNAAYELNFASTNSPDDARVPHLMGLLNETLGNHDQAGQLLARAAALDPADAEILMDFGNHERFHGAGLIAGEAIFAQLLEQQIDHIGGHAALADVYTEQQRRDDALGVIGWLVWRVPAEPNTWIRLATVEENGGRYSEAADAWRRAAELSGRDASVWLRLARACHEDYADDDAERALARALECDDELAAAYLLRATIRSEQGEDAAAIRDLRQALYLDLDLVRRECPVDLVERFIEVAPEADDWREVFRDRLRY